MARQKDRFSSVTIVERSAMVTAPSILWYSGCGPHTEQVVDGDPIIGTASRLRAFRRRGPGDFIQAYPEKYEKQYGFLKPVVEDVVNKYLDCGDLTKGFARIYCENCKKSMLLPFSCKGRWFCPSCHEKKVLLFGESITGTIAFPVPHRQYVFSLPIMLRIYFRNNRQLLKKLCRIANECLLEFLRRSLDRPAGQLGMVMTIHTFGEYMGYNCHILCGAPHKMCNVQRRIMWS